MTRTAKFSCCLLAIGLFAVGSAHAEPASNRISVTVDKIVSLRLGDRTYLFGSGRGGERAFPRLWIVIRGATEVVQTCIADNFSAGFNLRGVGTLTYSAQSGQSSPLAVVKLSYPDCVPALLQNVLVSTSIRFSIGKGRENRIATDANLAWIHHSGDHLSLFHYLIFPMLRPLVSFEHRIHFSLSRPDAVNARSIRIEDREGEILSESTCPAPWPGPGGGSSFERCQTSITAIQEQYNDTGGRFVNASVWPGKLVATYADGSERHSIINPPSSSSP